jgi:hypothetical protein
MANKILWEAAPASRGNVLTTELNSLANGGYSAAGTEIDNSANLDQWGSFEINLASLNPTTGAYLQLFIVTAPDGTNYEDNPSSTNPGSHASVAIVSIATGSATKRVMTPWFRLPPTKFKVVLLNGAGVAFAASGSTVELFTNNDEVQ